VLFLGDCMYSSSAGAMTAELALPLLDAILEFDAELYVDGHSESVVSRPELRDLIEKVRSAERAVRDGAEVAAPDEDLEYFLQAFRAGSASAG
jgi:hypothetical protein